MTATSYFSEPDYKTFDGLQCSLSSSSLRTIKTLPIGISKTPSRIKRSYRAWSSQKQDWLTVYVPGDVTDSQMDALADLQMSTVLASAYPSAEPVLADIETNKLYELWQQLSDLHLARPTQYLN